MSTVAKSVKSGGSGRGSTLTHTSKSNNSTLKNEPIRY